MTLHKSEYNAGGRVAEAQRNRQRLSFRVSESKEKRSHRGKGGEEEGGVAT